MRNAGHTSPAVKRQILTTMDKLFATEDKRVPLSDVEIAEELRAQGIGDVSETTVAYYRKTFYQLPNAQDRADRYRKTGAKNGK